MPEITDKEHVKQLRDATKLQNYQQVYSYSYTSSEGLDLSYRIFSSPEDILLCVYDKDHIIGNVDLLSINDMDLECLLGSSSLLQVQSVVVSKDYRGLGIAPHAYKLLCENYTVLSDSIQTHLGANLWRVKLSSSEDLHVKVISGFPNSPKILIENYSYTCSNDSEIWGVGFNDPRFVPEYDIGACTSDNRQDTLLAASKF